MLGTVDAFLFFLHDVLMNQFLDIERQKLGLRFSPKFLIVRRATRGVWV